MFAIETRPQEAAARYLDHSRLPRQENAVQLYHMRLLAYSWERGEEEIKQSREERFRERIYGGKSKSRLAVLGIVKSRDPMLLVIIIHVS
jgi:hypothetical protein